MPGEARHHDLNMSTEAYFSSGPWGEITEATHYLPNGSAAIQRRQPGEPGYPFTFTFDSFVRADGGALPPSFGTANWFAWGSLHAGRDLIAIRQSPAFSGGQIELTLARDPTVALAVGDLVELRPGCDGLAETCGGKFDNFVNWGGARVAAANLSLVKVNVPEADSGGKK